MASFGSAFNAARKAGKKVFTWNGKSYNTKVAADTPKTAPRPSPRPQISIPTPTPRPTLENARSNVNGREVLRPQVASETIKGRDVTPKPTQAKAEPGVVRRKYRRPKITF